MRPSFLYRKDDSRRRGNCFRPLLEWLEDRAVPSSGPINPLAPPTLPSASGSTLADDVPGNSFATIRLDAAGAATRTGNIDFPGDVDRYAFISSVTGQTTIKVDGGVIPEQVAPILVTKGQTYAFSVFADGTATGGYHITISSIADDFPDVTTFPIVLKPDGSGVQNGVINYARDVDAFRFTAPVSGIMTLTMTPISSGLRSSAKVTGPTGIPLPGAALLDDFTPSSGAEIVQFRVVAGRQYGVRAVGALGSQGKYTLAFAMVTDDFSPSVPTSINLDAPDFFASVENAKEPGHTALSGVFEHGSQSGSIEVPDDVDLFQFTSGTTGYALIQLVGTPGTDFHGMLTTSNNGFLINAAVEATLTTQLDGNTLDPIILIPVVEGQSYQIGVSGNAILAGKPTGPTIGKYTLIVDTFSSDARGDLLVRRGAFDPPDVSIDIKARFSFNGPSGAPVFFLSEFAIAPEMPPTAPSAPTDARLAVITLPSAPPPPPPTVDVPLLETGSTSPLTGGTLGGEAGNSSRPAGDVSTGKAGDSSQPTSSLVATLLTVAARDNSIGSLAVATSPTSTLVTVAVSETGATIQRGVAAPGGGEDDTTISGNIFDDLNGDGIKQSEEPGLPGETVVLERVHQGKNVAVVTATDAKGYFRFANLEPGEYHVSLRRKTDPPDALSRPARVLVRIGLGSIPAVVNIGKQGSSGVRLDLEPFDLTAVAIPSVGALGEDFWLLSELQSETLEVRSPEAIDAVCTGCLFLISGAPLRPHHADRSGGRSAGFSWATRHAGGD